MIVTARQFFGLPVVTKSGLYVGRVIDVEIDVVSHTILRYRVRSKGLFHFLSRYDFLVSATQVVRVTSECMVVEDTFVKEKASPALGGRLIEVAGA